jgi:hypothetical protein
LPFSNPNNEPRRHLAAVRHDPKTVLTVWNDFEAWRKQ